MTKIFVTTVLFMLALSVLALDAKALLQYQKPINLAYGIKVNKDINVMDFSVPVYKDIDYRDKMVVVNSENNLFAGYNTDTFYNIDFAEEPFDGRIEVLVMGEPLPSGIVSLFIAAGIAGLLYFRRNKLNPINQ